LHGNGYGNQFQAYCMQIVFVHPVC